MRDPRRHFAVLLLVALLAACASPSTTPSPSVSAPDGSDATPTTDATVSSEESPDGSVPKPSGNLTFAISQGSSLGFSHLPAVMTMERLNSEGWDISHVLFAGGDLNTAAVASNQVQMAGGSASSTFIAIDLGAHLALVVERNSNENAIISRADINSCDDVDDSVVVGHDTPANANTVMLLAYFEDCGNPTYTLTTGGSATRAAAMINGVVDATVLELPDWLALDAQAPGQFHVLEDFATGLPELAQYAYVANTDWLAENREVAVAFVAELLRTHRMIADNPQLIGDAAVKHIEGFDASILPDLLDLYLELNILPPNGGLTESRVDYTIHFFEAVPQDLTVDQVADFSILEDALEIIGTVPGKP